MTKTSSNNFKSIFFVTYGAYKNCGQFFDFLLAEFDYFIFLDLKSHHTSISNKTTLFIYKSKKLFLKKELFTPLQNPPVFIVPFYHLIYFLNIVYALFLVKRYTKIKPQFFITSFSIWALGGCVGRFFNLCSKVILWSWDYYPLYRDNPYYYIQLMLEPFEKLAIKYSDFSWYAAQSNFDIRCKIKQIKDPKNKKHRVVHWGTGGDLKGPVLSNFKKSKMLHLVYFGAIHFEKGLDLVIDSIDQLVTVTNGRFKISIIGGNTPYKQELVGKLKEKSYDKYVKFIDFMPFEKFKVFSKTADLGLALFVPEIGGKINFSHYADPAKPRDYLALGLPMLITTVPFIHKSIEQYNAGFVLKDYSTAALVKAVKKYMKNPKKYKEGAYNLSQVDRYDEYYKTQFESIMT